MKGITDKPIRYDKEDRFSIKPYVDGLCSFIREWEELEVFPTVELNEALFDEDESKPWYGMAVSIQEELPKFYKDLQEAYGKKAYADPDYTGKDFLIYSEAQTEFLIQTLLSVFCPDGRKMWVLV